MNNASSRYIARRFAVCIIAALTCVKPYPADLASAPLGTGGTSTAVRPNLMFVLDDSGSMMQDYTPDWVGKVPDLGYCKNAIWSGNTSGVCVNGTPPFTSPQFNSQYYNPAVRYSPPKNADGTNQPSMTSAYTSTWTAVPIDPTGTQPYQSNRFNNDSLPEPTFLAKGATAVYDITSKYPDLKYCDNNDTVYNCGTGRFQKNLRDAVSTTNDYRYPDTTYRWPTYTQDSAPYYYSISSGTWCTSADFTDCQYATGPSGAYTFPAAYRWCDNANSAATGAKCRSRRTDGVYKYVDFQGGVIPGTLGSVASGRFDIDKLGDSALNTLTTVTSVTVGSVNLMTSAAAVAGVNSEANRDLLADRIVAAIPAGGVTVGSCTYKATTNRNQNNRSEVVITSVEQSADCNAPVTVAISNVTYTPSYPLTFDTSRTNAVTAGPINIMNTSGGGNSAKASASFALEALGSASLKSDSVISRVLVGGVDILPAPVTVSAIDGSTKRTSMMAAVRSAINANAASLWTAGGTGATLTLTAKNNGSLYNNLQVRVYWSDSYSNPDNVDHGIVLSPDAASIVIGGGVTPVPDQNVGGAIFERVDIVPTRTTYPKVAGNDRSDCDEGEASPDAFCSYEQEMTNFANWFAYYRTRMQTMKSAASMAFSTLTDQYRVGFLTINPTSTARFLKLDTFSSTHRNNWYAKLFAQGENGGTPLREALSRVGRYYAGKTDGINTVTSGDPSPIQYACQQNFTLLTTDGYWNGNAGQKLDGTAMDNQDNDESATESYTDTGGVNVTVPVSRRVDGVFDGYPTAVDANSRATTRTLADVAAYYYRTDLLPESDSSISADLSADKVPTTATDKAGWQHMTTFTLGLGVDGQMRYDKDYATKSSGDFYSIKSNAKGCEWESSATADCNWPTVRADSDTAVDDLWHAAVNGRGRYFSAKRPDEVVRGLTDALSSIAAKTGAAASAATSTPVITQSDNQVFVTTYRTSVWDGEIVAKTIDATNGTISAAAQWSASAKLAAIAAADRKIYTRSSTGERLNFAWSNADALDAVAKGYLTNKASLLPQNGALSSDARATLNDGENMLNFLRGDATNADGIIFRSRQSKLGDTVNASPVFVRNPRRAYLDTGYLGVGGFKEANKNRVGMLYAGANDGMLHAIDAATGVEKWAYVPRMLIPNLYKLASTGYPANHEYFVDGTPAIEDVYDASATPARWRTILVAGLNGGGRGYYALDITDPLDPQVLWEFCSDSSLCSNSDADLGFSYGNPVIAKRKSDGKWVVFFASGYAKGASATQPGRLYAVDAITGTKLSETVVGGDGLAKLGSYVENYEENNSVEYLYGADLTGKVWKFDVTVNPITASQIASLSVTSGTTTTAQPVTTKPIVSMCRGQRIVLIGTGKFLGDSDYDDKQRQSAYVFRDDLPSERQVLNGSSTMVKQEFSYDATGKKWNYSNTAVDILSDDGWYVDLTRDEGERVSVDPLLTRKLFILPTNIPAKTPKACTVGGQSRLYDFDYCNGKLLKTIQNESLSPGSTYAFLGENVLTITTLTSGEMKTDIHNPSGTGVGNTARRVSWRELVPAAE